eukprot:9386-Heterococcus_DN1.PRE.2
MQCCAASACKGERAQSKHDTCKLPLHAAAVSYCCGIQHWQTPPQLRAQSEQTHDVLTVTHCITTQEFLLVSNVGIALVCATSQGTMLDAHYAVFNSDPLLGVLLSF